MSLPRIGLAEAFVAAVVFCGLLAALRFAGEILTSLIGLLAGLLFLYAVVAAIFGRGSARAAAGGFAIGAGLYGLLFVAAGMRQETDLLGFEIYGSFGNSHSELRFAAAELPTTALLEPLYNVLAVEQWTQTDTGETMTITRGGDGTLYDPWGRVFDPASPAVPRTWRREATNPEAANFLAVGHFGWALLFGYAGSLFARMAYARGARETSSGERRV
ncbi:MAG TPA: hypothetical protein VGN57_09605 [Pirellulaceae bacterium]|jgi:hypothetical protein|nr:hypothetical protein [Pirellulaceae bacterium]